LTNPHAGTRIICSGCGQSRYPQTRTECRGCVQKRSAEGDYRFWPGPLLMEEWARLRMDGLSWQQGADRLGVPKNTLHQAYLRGRKRGDPNALPPLGAP